MRRPGRPARGGGIAYPTEAVWGLLRPVERGCGVSRLLALKARAGGKGPDRGGGRDIPPARLPFSSKTCRTSGWTAGRYLAGPRTWLVPAPGAPAGVSSASTRASPCGSPTIPWYRNCAISPGPLISTSANPAGRPARTRLRVEQYFHDELDAILGGAWRARNPSLIRDLVTGQVIPPGLKYALQGNSTVEPWFAVRPVRYAPWLLRPGALVDLDADVAALDQAEQPRRPSPGVFRGIGVAAQGRPGHVQRTPSARGCRG